MTAKKPTKPAKATPETELLAKLQLEVQTREVELEGKEKIIDELVRKHKETLERLAGMLGCQPGNLEQGMATMQALVQEIRDVVEPEVADVHPATLPDACKHLVGCLHAAHRDNDGLQQFIRDMQTKLDDAERRIEKLRADGREVWGALDGDVEECTLVELAEKRWKEIERLREAIDRTNRILCIEGRINADDMLAELTRIRDLVVPEIGYDPDTLAKGCQRLVQSLHIARADAEQQQERWMAANSRVEELTAELNDAKANAEGATLSQDGGEAANILNDLMRKLVDGRITLIHNA